MRRCIAALLLLAALVAAPAAQGRARMRFLDNGMVRVGVDLGEGGVITYIARSRSRRNVVNNHDLGREIQPSYYAGPEGLGEPCWNFSTVWNPIGAGDCYGRGSTILASRNDGWTIYVKSRPLQWAFDNMACECTFEQWVTLDGRAVAVRSRLTNSRADRTLYPPLGQELPAVYTNGRLSRLVTYGGASPWTGGRLRTVTAGLPQPASFRATERWAAYVDRRGFGLGVFSPTVTTFLGGFWGKRGLGGPADDNTGYVSPTRPELLDWNIVYDYDYALVLGPLRLIRQYASTHRPPAGPDWRFDTGREGFVYANAGDAGFPIADALRVRLDRRDPQLLSPVTFWRAEDVPAVDVRMALHGTNGHEAALRWAGLDDGFEDARKVAFPVVADGAFHTYRVPLAGAPSYSGAITRLRLDPIESGEARGAYAEVDSITAAPAG